MLIEMMKKLVLLIVPSLGSREKYRPERHYMRGPGPKSNKANNTRKAKALAPRPGEPDQAEA